jgi:protein-S-isoprenylcysteine O-methyltransferase Ste14
MTEPTEQATLRGQSRGVVRAAVGFGVYALGVPALLFIAAGTLDWPMAWLYVGLLLTSTLGSRLVVLVRNPDLLRERAQFTQAKDTQAWDRLLVAIVGLLGPIVMMVVAGLDHRFGWPPSVSRLCQVGAAVLIAASYGVAVWAMVINPYFSAVARIQEDRGQVVIGAGPYRLIRHPSYAGALVAALAVPVMLDALWALVPGIAVGVALVIRTRLEDRMLHHDLAGYAAYATKTRYRLVPGIW